MGMSERRTTDQSVSTTLRDILQRRGISTRDIARRMSRQPGTISKKLNAISPWTAGELLEFADALRVTAIHLMHEIEQDWKTTAQIPGD
ncbi:MAG: helix-turn-helix domain-containing protein [Propionibacteriaceae bacterium]|jgi:transcriptional regulator with XRE-family HTH domain|nr:helix-turn-helix domain-containing protein [Propionibacteriaceae bacterium]